MSLNFRKVGVLAAVSTAAVAMPGSAFAAQTSQITYKCKFPLIGPKTLVMDISLGVPDTTPAGAENGTGEFDINATATAKNTGPALDLVDGLKFLKGVNTPNPVNGMTAFSRVLKPDGSAISVNVPVNLETYEINPPTPVDVPFKATAKTPSLFLDDLGEYQIVFDRIQMNLSGTDANGVPIEGLTTPSKGVDGVTPFTDTDRPAGMPANEDPTFNVPCVLDPATQNTVIGKFKVVEGGTTPPPNTPPTEPGESTAYTAADFTPTSINVRWLPSTDDKGVVKYEITYDGLDGVKTVEAPGNATSKLITGLGPDSGYVFSIVAVDAEGAKSTVYQTEELFTPIEPTTPVDNVKPSKPGTITATPSTTSVALSWGASTDNVGVKEYVVTGGGKTVTTTTTSASVTGLTKATPYTFTVVAKDAAGNTSDAATVNTTTKSDVAPSNLKYKLAGSTEVKTLSRGSLPLTGAINADFTVATGKFEADLTLNDTSGRLTALGFLPVTAKIGFVPSGKTTGDLSNDTGVLTTNSLVRIKVKEVKLFGAIPLAGGNNCQTKSLSKIVLKSGVNFDPLTGGQITGTYAISDLNGCGVLNGLVSPLTAGGGNTIKLGLTYLPPATS